LRAMNKIIAQTCVFNLHRAFTLWHRSLHTVV
jgi:hypothetical protein